MNELINSEFLRTIIAVLIGGVISFISVFAIDIRNRKKEKRERKRLIYKSLISNINLLRRYEQHFAGHDLHFNYQRRNFELDKKDSLSKEQAEYHQRKRDEAHLKLVEISEVIDSSAIDYRIYFGEDDEFDKLMMKINMWKRPEIPNYTVIDNLTELNDQHEKDRKHLTRYILEHLTEAVGNLAIHMKKKLD
ncbi:hypothetical protein [Winogradskyella sediminis]|uniref:hypothetical protein n=1 Tax=Winogradskyella sediminis TaxID=1382466 RepID=UPI003AA98054